MTVTRADGGEACWYGFRRNHGVFNVVVIKVGKINRESMKNSLKGEKKKRVFMFRGDSL